MPASIAGMDNILTCDLCMERFSPGEHDPLFLQCGHTYCRSCLRNIRKENMVFRCPACRRPQPNIDVDDLPVNYKLLSGVSECHKEKSDTCDEHGDALSYWCQDCCLSLCAMCIIVGHQEHRVVKGKSFLSIKKGLLESHVHKWIKHNAAVLARKLQMLTVELKNWIQSESKFSKAQKDVDKLLTKIKGVFESEVFDNVNSEIRNITVDAEAFVSSQSCLAQAAVGQDEQPSYCIQNNDGRRSLLHWQEGKLRLSSFGEARIGTDLLLKIPSEVYLELSIEDKLLGCIIIQPWYHLRRAQQFAALCLGILGVSYLGASFIAVRFADQPGEYLLGGWYLSSLGGVPSTRDLMTDLEWGQKASGDFGIGIVFGASIEGEAIDISNGKSGFGICVQGQRDGTLKCPFGEVVSGLDVVKKAIKHDPVTDVTITGCGLIISNLDG